MALPSKGAMLIVFEATPHGFPVHAPYVLVCRKDHSAIAPERY